MAAALAGDLEVLAEDVRYPTGDGGRYFAWTRGEEPGVVFSHDSVTGATRRFATPGCWPATVERNAAAGRLVLTCADGRSRLLRLGTGVVETLPSRVRGKRETWWAIGERWVVGNWFEWRGRRYVPYLDFRSGRVVVKREDYAVLWNIDRRRLTRMCPLAPRRLRGDEWPGERDFSAGHRLAPSGLPVVYRCNPRRVVFRRRGASAYLTPAWVSWVRGGRGHVASLRSGRSSSFALPAPEVSNQSGGGSGLIHNRREVLVSQPTSVTCAQSGCRFDGYRLWRARLR